MDLHKHDLTSLEVFYIKICILQIYLHGNNLSTLHEHLPTDILPAELGGTGPAFNPGLWAEPVIHSAMKEAEIAAMKKEKELAESAEQSCDNRYESRSTDDYKTNEADSTKPSNGVSRENGRRFFNPFGNSTRNQSMKKTGGTNVELNLINRSNGHEERRRDSETIKDDEDSYCRIKNKTLNNSNSDYYNDNKEGCKESEDNLLGFQSEKNSHEFEVSNRPDSDDSKDNSLDNRSENSLIDSGKNETPSEETNLIT